MHDVILDSKDHEILKVVLRSAETPKSEIARRIGIAPSAVSERMKRLRERKLIRRHETRVDPQEMGYPVLAYVFVVEVKPLSGPPLGEQLARVPGVEEVHKIAGEDCYLVKLRAASNSHLAHILESHINPLPSVGGVRTTIVLRTILEDVVLGGINEFRDSDNRSFEK